MEGDLCNWSHSPFLALASTDLFPTILAYPDTHRTERGCRACFPVPVDDCRADAIVDARAVGKNLDFLFHLLGTLDRVAFVFVNTMFVRGECRCALISSTSFGWMATR